MNYELKNKISITKDLLNEIQSKGWQEIEHLQAQITNLAEGSTNDKLRKLFNNLLTSYYVFVGGIETLTEEPIENAITASTKNEVEDSVEKVEQEILIDDHETQDDNENDYVPKDDDISIEVSEPFEYFIDFDDPIGEPITDEDLYNN